MVGVEKAVEKQISLRLAEVNEKIVTVLLNEEEKIYREALNVNAAEVSVHRNVASTSLACYPSAIQLARAWLPFGVRV